MFPPIREDGTSGKSPVLVEGFLREERRGIRGPGMKERKVIVENPEKIPREG